MLSEVTVSPVLEQIALDTDQREAYEQTRSLLQTRATSLAPPFAVVPFQEGIESTSPSLLHSPPRTLWMQNDVSMPSLLIVGRTQLLQEALQQLEGLEKQEAMLFERSPLTRELTSIITNEEYDDAPQALERLVSLGKTVPRRVCQHPFRKNDIVWVCRTCQADETCVLCHACFTQSDHEGHDVNFYHAQAGGCCDCGDPDAWDPKGFCPHHGPAAAANVRGEGTLPKRLSHRVRGAVPAIVDWLVQTIAQNSEVAFQRSNLYNADGSHAVDWEEEIMEEELTHRTHLFSPSAASLPRSHRPNLTSPETAEALGRLGSAGRGLYLVLHADDIHVKPQVVGALKFFWGIQFPEMVLNSMVDALKTHGQLIVWGTAEIVAEIGPTQAHLWSDGDRVVSTRVGELVLERASRLVRHGLFCSILSYDELLLEQRAVAVVQWLSVVARSCDPLCQTVAECILPNRHLVPLLMSDFKMSSRVTKAWYSLLLTLLAVPTFKSHLATAYCDTYCDVTAKYARGMGVLERSGYTLSVQFLNRVTYVVEMVQARDLLGKLGTSLRETLLVAKGTKHHRGRLNPNHFVLAHRRYSPCISDLKCVLNVKGMSRVAIGSRGTFLTDWIATLGAAQFIDPQSWRNTLQGHLEDESRGWVGAFNTTISLGSLFERLLGWQDSDESPLSASPYTGTLMTCVELAHYVLMNGVDPWQNAEINGEHASIERKSSRSSDDTRLSPLLLTSGIRGMYSQQSEIEEMSPYRPTPLPSSLLPHQRCPASLPFSTIARKNGTCLAMRQIPIAQATPFSFHLPLHRFVSSIVRELCLRVNDAEFGISNLMKRLHNSIDEQSNLFLGLMEFPMLVISRVAQVRADLWKRNGTGLNDQVLNYAEPPFCRNMRDADLLLVQLSVLGRIHHVSVPHRSQADVGMAFLSNLLLHRLGIFEFCGFALAPNEDIDTYQQEVTLGFYPGELKSAELSPVDPVLPWAYTPSGDASSLMKLVEEYLHFMVVFISELPSPVPSSKNEHTQRAKYRLFREVVHRLASGPKTHSELSEVHHVLSHWDNILLSEEGKLVNPDDANGAALGAVLADVADRKVSRSGKPEPDKWELRHSAWDGYDPAFFHLSSRHHQTAAENRPKPRADQTLMFGWEPRPFVANSINAHEFFTRLRRDATTDAVVLAMVYKVLHLHFRSETLKDFDGYRPPGIYQSNEKSETALARAVHLLTLGLYAWEDADSNDHEWRSHGGGSAGSIFWEWLEKSAPTVEDWINRSLLQDPCKLLDCEWLKGDENILKLLKRLALDGRSSGGFVAQDACVRAGAAWICQFALSHSKQAASLLIPDQDNIVSLQGGDERETEIEKRKRIAKEKAMAKMKAHAAKFASMMDVNLDKTDGKESNGDNVAPVEFCSPHRAGSFGSILSSSSSVVTDVESSWMVVPSFVSLASEVGNIDLANIPPRLLQKRPRCIICNDEECTEMRSSEMDESENQRKKSRRSAENAIGLVGYLQPSTVLKGGGGPPSEPFSPRSPTSELVGVHIALCGHAVHFECCESYLASVSHREYSSVGKRDEFRCPLCQRLSNCLVPFIDVGMDWIEHSTRVDGTDPRMIRDGKPIATKEEVNLAKNHCYRPSLGTFLEHSGWWVGLRSDIYGWDGHAAFVEKQHVTKHEEGHDVISPGRPLRKIRSLKKKDLYAAWNAMMRTPRNVRRRLRPRLSPSRTAESLTESHDGSKGEDSSGETLVWRRFMDQVADVGLKADVKRLGEHRLNESFGEFRHFIVEKHAYNLAKTISGISDFKEWPYCMFEGTISDTKRQELSREKLISKLLLSIQAFTYSCCCEAFDARRAFNKCVGSASNMSSGQLCTRLEAICSRFGIKGVMCNGQVVVLASPSLHGEGSQAFDGRLGKLRYVGLACISAAGAVSTDLVQLALSFPTDLDFSSKPQEHQPKRAPITFPILLGHVMTHVVAALFAVCGRARAIGDSIDMWQVPQSSRFIPDSHGQTTQKRVDTIVDDCENFVKLGLLARITQVLLGTLRLPRAGVVHTALLISLRRATEEVRGSIPEAEFSWVSTCLDILEASFSEGRGEPTSFPGADVFFAGCELALEAACSFITDVGAILQVLVPGVMSRYDPWPQTVTDLDSSEGNVTPLITFNRLCTFFHIESLQDMLKSPLTRQVLSNWYSTALAFVTSEVSVHDSNRNLLQKYLNRTQGFRVYDWPLTDSIENQIDPFEQAFTKLPEEFALEGCNTVGESRPVLVTFSSKKSVPLIGGPLDKAILSSDACPLPRVAVIPTSYTDLYAELGALLPDCEQTAVCLVCGEVMNAAGKGECTKHSYKCGAGAGIFFLLQECTGLIMHKSKAAYIHSPYVDSHGETPQYRGRPLNLDIDRYDHLKDIWYGHGLRQQVVAERGCSRQVIHQDYY